VSFEARKIRLVMMLRQAGVSDTRVLAAVERIPREEFVPAFFRDRAYEDTALPVGHGQTISRPVVVALMTDRLQIGDRMKVLEIGTGTGYQTAILARLCRRVYTIERHRELLVQAETRLRTLKLHNITARHGDGWYGWPPVAPFDRIIAAAAAPDVPGTLADQLADGGMMIVPVGVRASEQKLVRLRREGGRFSSEEILRAHFVPLVRHLPKEGEEAVG